MLLHALILHPQHSLEGLEVVVGRAEVGLAAVAAGNMAFAVEVSEDPCKGTNVTGWRR